MTRASHMRTPDLVRGLAYFLAVMLAVVGLLAWALASTGGL